MQLILLWVVNALALLLVANFLPGFTIEGFWSALWVALLLGLVNAIIRPIVLLLTLPLTILTLGLFAFVINALMLWLVSALVGSFTIDSFGTAILAAITLWLISFLTNWLLNRID